MKRYGRAAEVKGRRERTESSARQGSLTVVGTGIRLVAQTTPEALASIERADRVLYLVADPATKAWIQRVNRTAESLEDCYSEGKLRSESYAEMVRRIVAPVREGLSVCAAFYGHPGTFVQPSHEAIRLVRSEGFVARMLPGVSAEDCLFADLGVDPARDGCQSFEATDFLVRPRNFDATSVLILWQIGVIGEARTRVRLPHEARGLRLLTEQLRRHYSGRHEVVVYEAAPYPVCEPLILRIRLSRLPTAAVPPLATLYVPPKTSAPAVDLSMLARLGLTAVSRPERNRRQRV
jgi:tetrapyrrole (corrin/porphyrin) methylase-like protein